MATEFPVESPATPFEVQTVETILHRVVDDVAMIVDHSFSAKDVEVARIESRTAGRDQVHISFKLRVTQGEVDRYGALLMPLPEAIALAGYLMMMPDDAVDARRGDQALDASTKDALMEVSNFIGGAVDAALREAFDGTIRAGSAGCQGVRADVRPAFPYQEGDELLLVRAQAVIHEHPAFELILMLPSIFPG